MLVRSLYREGVQRVDIGEVLGIPCILDKEPYSESLRYTKPEILPLHESKYSETRNQICQVLQLGGG